MVEDSTELPWRESCRGEGPPAINVLWPLPVAPHATARAALGRGKKRANPACQGLEGGLSIGIMVYHSDVWSKTWNN